MRKQDHLRGVFLLLVSFTVMGISGCGQDSVNSEKINSEKIFRAAPGSVNIYRDTYGMAHLYAEREEDGYWGFGYATAEDRLKGVLLFYLSVKGEMAKAFGPGKIKSKDEVARGVYLPFGEISDTVASDIHMRQLRHLEDARLNLPKLPRQLQLNMAAYIAGMKQYMAEHPEQVPSWAPTLEAALPLAVASVVMLRANVCGKVIAARKKKPVSGLDGSNLWAFPADRMTENAAVLVSDSHGGIEWPYGTFLSPARLNAGALDAWQLDVPGMILGLKGHSRHFAWGWSEGPRRPADCIVIETMKEDPTTYLYDGKPEKMQVYPYVIEVKGQDPVRGEFEYSRHNNVLSPVVHRDGTTAFAVSSAYMQRAGFAHKQFREMFLAPDEKSMREVLQSREIYPANLMYAGEDGSITFIRPGRIPLRPEGNDGQNPVDGNRSAGAWHGIHALDNLVQITNPPQKYLVNNNVSPDKMFRDPVFKAADYPPDYAFNDRTGTRQKRAIDLFEGDAKFSFEDVLDFISDDYVWGSEAWGRAIARALEDNPDVPTQQDSDFQNFLEALINFDGHFPPKSQGGLYHALTRERLRMETVEMALPIEVAIGQGQTLTKIQQRALLSVAVKAYVDLRDNLGGLSKRFGDIFRIGRGGTSAPSRGFSLKPLGGNRKTVSASLWSTVYTGPDKDGFRWAVIGSRSPYIVQFTKPIRSYSLAVYGASDNPASPHYSDQSVRVSEGGLHPNFFEPFELSGAVVNGRTLYTGLK